MRLAPRSVSIIFLFAPSFLYSKGISSSQWIMGNTQYRLPTKEECDPNQILGDFNKDSNKDMAMVVIDKTNNNNDFYLVVFNGPNGKTKAFPPTFISSAMNLEGYGLYYEDQQVIFRTRSIEEGPFLSRKWRLIPKKKTYILEVE